MVVAAVLIPLGVLLRLFRAARTDAPGRPARQIPAPLLVVLAMAVGCVGETYGIGGSAILAPGLIGSGRKPSEVAPAALASNLVTSAGGVITFTVLSLHQHISAAPDWPTGIARRRVARVPNVGSKIMHRATDLFLIREVQEALMISRCTDYLWLAVRVCALMSVPVSGDRHSVSYSPPGTARREPTQPFDP